MAMKQAVVQRLLRATCAVIHLKRAPQREDDPGEFFVIGSGFVVAQDLVLTNRHVIEAHGELFPHERYVVFVHPRPEGGIDMPMMRSRLAMKIEHGADIGVIRVSPRDPAAFAACALPVCSTLGFEIGDDIATCGYPLGEELLRSAHFGPSGLRHGPLVLQGHVAGIAPFPMPPVHADSFLTDIRTGQGLSGGPVVNRESGEVIGVHYAGQGGAAGRIGVAFPLDRQRVDQIISHYRSRAAPIEKVEPQIQALVDQGVPPAEALARFGFNSKGERVIDGGIAL